MRKNLGKTCYCKTCEKWFSYLGICNHRKGHFNRKEDCEITYTDGSTKIHKYTELQYFNWELGKMDVIKMDVIK